MLEVALAVREAGESKKETHEAGKPKKSEEIKNELDCPNVNSK